MCSKGAYQLPRILLMAPSFEPAVKAGGPARTLTNLVRILDGRYLIDVVTPDRDLGDPSPFPGLPGPPVSRGTTTLYYLSATSPTQALSLLKELGSNTYDLIMINSIWNLRYALVPVLLTILGVLRGPVLLLPHGELEPGALARKSLKKRLAGPPFRAVYRRGVSLFGATSEAERVRVLGWFPRGKVVSTSNNLPDEISWGQPATRGPCLQALYLSRIHPTKGLLPLLRGLSLAGRPIDLRVVGPVEDSAYAAHCRQVAAQLPEHISVVFHDLAPRSEVAQLLWNADVMILLTAGENYGHVIAEALQAGCPVIATTTTPWTETLRRGGGAIVGNRDDPVEIAAVLEEWSAKTPEALVEARFKARDVFDHFQAAAGPNIIDLAFEALGKT